MALKKKNLFPVVTLPLICANRALRAKLVFIYFLNKNFKSRQAPPSGRDCLGDLGTVGSRRPWLGDFAEWNHLLSVATGEGSGGVEL